jgi:Raf kinase inhibitor-like YbhB/YbcL family protein
MTHMAYRFARFARPALAFAALVVAPALALAAGPFTVVSAEVKHKRTMADAQIYNAFGCTGGNISPSLSWRNPPPGTRSFAVTVYDPDAPTGSGWWHWVVFNLPPGTASLPADAGNPAAGKLPAGAIQSRTDFGAPGYGGPCPPLGDKPHRYIFTVHALKVDQLALDENASPAMVGFMLHANHLGRASLTARYGRK